MRTDPPTGATKPMSTFSSVDLPQPLAPVSATISPGATRKRDAVERRAITAGIGHPELVDRDRGRSQRSGISVCVPRGASGASSTSNSCPAALTPSALAW